jgi:TPP-dependent 2-oxoacid decarboxylase
MVAPATVATYLIGRLKQAGLRHAFGVPGDYVLSFMDRLIEHGIEPLAPVTSSTPATRPTPMPASTASAVSA